MRFSPDKDGLRQGLSMSTVMMAAMAIYASSTTPYRFWTMMGALMFIQQRYNEPFPIRLPILLYSAFGALIVAVPFAMLGQLSWWWFAAGLALLAFVGMWLGGVWGPWQGVTTSVLLVAMFAGSLTPLFIGHEPVNVFVMEFHLALGIGLAILFAWIWDTLIPRRNFPNQALLVFKEIQSSLRPVEFFFQVANSPDERTDIKKAATAEKTSYTRVAELTADLPIISKGYALGSCPLANSTLRIGRWLTTLTEALSRIPDKALVELAVPGAGVLAGNIVDGVARIVDRLSNTDQRGGKKNKRTGGWESAGDATKAASQGANAMERIQNDALAQMDWSAALAVVEVAFCLEQLARDLRKAEQRLEEVLP